MRATRGPGHTQGYKREAQNQAAQFKERLTSALARCNVMPRSEESPIFILSAGWRSGSTLLQRMMMQHNKKLLVWGETFNYAHVLERLMDQLRAFTDAWPKASYLISNRLTESLSDQGVANLYPDVEYLLSAHIKFLDELLAAQAKHLGYSTWGAKEVRWSSTQALYLKTLYPKAKFLLLYRNPYDAYASFYRICDGWFARWPEHMIATPYAFGRQWATLTEDFIAHHEELGALLVRYEDLDSPEKTAELSAYLGWEVPRARELRRLVTDKIEAKGPEHTRLPAVDRALLSLAVRKTAKRAGY